MKKGSRSFSSSWRRANRYFRNFYSAHAQCEILGVVAADKTVAAAITIAFTKYLILTGEKWRRSYVNNPLCL